MPPLRLAVDARVVAEDTRGIGRYARAILRRLVRRDDVELTLLAFGPFVLRHRGALARALGSGNFALRSRVPRDAAVVWHPANGTFFDPGAAPSVATIHDAVPFRYPPDDPARRARDQEPFLRSARTAARVVAVSAFGAEELHQVFGIPRERIAVIHHGVEPSFSPGPPETLPAGVRAGEYFLFVGDPVGEPRKNFAMLLEAYRRAFADRPDAPALVVAGSRDPQTEGVIHAGNLGDDLQGSTNTALRSLYRGALALTMASYHETFGMPMAEAMACGTPVVASTGSCLPEIAGDAALYAPPGDAGVWAQRLADVAADGALRDRLRAAGLARAKLYDWDVSARRHLELFRTVAGGAA